MWYDTANNFWYMRNASNNAWIQLATFNQANNTVNFIDSTGTIAGIATSATNTVMTLANGSVAIAPAGHVSVGGGATQSGEIRFLEDTDNGSNYISLKAPTTVSSNVGFILPIADGTANQVIQTNGSGQLSFVTSASGITAGFAIAMSIAL
jgi:hypothetical protein